MPEVEIARPAPEYPWPHFPVVFVDGAISCAFNPATVKFYLGRVDPDFWGSNNPKTTPVVQVVMPMDNFIAFTAFLENQLSTFIKSGSLTQERVDEVKKSLSGGETA